MDYSFEQFWQAFQVPAEMTNRHHACYDLWCRLSEMKKRAIAHELQRHLTASSQTKQRNPYYFLQDYPEPRPQAIVGIRIETLYREGVPLVVAFCDGKAGVYKREDAEMFGLQIVRELRIEN